jgi:tRNA threonylcarbamoyladenosine biosynthesis protein TsaB
MGLILSLETSASICAVALHDQGVMLASAEVHIAQSHASKLAPLIEEVRKMAAVEMSALKAIAISAGPGSYTGLRIGASTAKGLCYALNIPLLAVNTLELMVHQAKQINIHQAMLCPMIDARRMEVYCLLTDAQLKVLQPVEAKIVDDTSFLEFLRESDILFFGSGAEKCRDMITHPNARFISNLYPSAGMLGVLAFEKYQKGQVEDLASFEPFYLKEFAVKKPVTTP